MKKSAFNIFFLLILVSNISYSQVVADSFYVPNYPIPELYFTDNAPELPENVWNHKSEYFPNHIRNQVASSCGQVAGIYNCMTYMFNRFYDREVDSSNTFPEVYTYNQITTWYGVSPFDSWNFVKSQGNASIKEYHRNVDSLDLDYIDLLYYWLNGYNNYYKSFFNRITGYYSLNLKTEQDLILLKHYFNNMFELGKQGGVAIFNSQPLKETPPFQSLVLPELEILGRNIKFNVIDTIYSHEIATHCMSIVGYYKNDSVDFNGDGLITDTLDINMDGVVDMHDNETTLWIVLNSGGSGHPHFLLKYDAVQLFWNQQVFFPIPNTSYSPELTFKLKLKHSERGDIKISAGISADLESDMPEIKIDFPVFNFQGRDICLKGIDTLPEPDVLEFGIDITDIKNYIYKPGTYKIFMQIENEGTSTGELQYFSILDYSNPTPVEHKVITSPTPVKPISKNYYSQIVNVDNKDFNNHLQVISPTKHISKVLDKLTIPINVEHGQAPYEFYLLDTNEYSVSLSYNEFPSDEGLEYDRIISKTINPDWDIRFGDKMWDSIKLFSSGEIIFTDVSIPSNDLYPYHSSMRQNHEYYFSPYELDALRKTYSYIATNITNDSIEIFNKKLFNMPQDTQEYRHLYYTKIKKDGVIKIIYGDTIPQYSIFTHIKTKMNKYFIPYKQSVEETFNTVTFTPNNAGNIFSIDENGVLTMQAVDETRKYETYVVVRDANKQEFIKRIEVSIISDEIIGSLYPNPTKGLIYFEINNLKEEDVIIEIYNLRGQLVYKQTSKLPQGINSYKLDTKQFNQGVYILKVSSNSQSQIKRFVVVS